MPRNEAVEWDGETYTVAYHEHARVRRRSYFPMNRSRGSVTVAYAQGDRALAARLRKRERVHHAHVVNPVGGAHVWRSDRDGRTVRAHRDRQGELIIHRSCRQRSIMPPATQAAISACSRSVRQLHGSR